MHEVILCGELRWHNLPSVLVPRRPEVVYNSCLCSLHWPQGTTLIPFQHPAPTPQYGSLFCENHIFPLLSWEAKYKSSLSQNLFQRATFPTAIVNPKSILHHFLPQPSIWDLFPCSALLLVSIAGLVGANQALNCLIFVRSHFLQLHLYGCPWVWKPRLNPVNSIGFRYTVP